MSRARPSVVVSSLFHSRPQAGGLGGVPLPLLEGGGDPLEETMRPRSGAAPGAGGSCLDMSLAPGNWDIKVPPEPPCGRGPFHPSHSAPSPRVSRERERAEMRVREAGGGGASSASFESLESGWRASILSSYLTHYVRDIECQRRWSGWPEAPDLARGGE